MVGYLFVKAKLGIKSFELQNALILSQDFSTATRLALVIFDFLQKLLWLRLQIKATFWLCKKFFDWWLEIPYYCGSFRKTIEACFFKKHYNFWKYIFLVFGEFFSVWIKTSWESWERKGGRRRLGLTRARMSALTLTTLLRF